MELGQGTRYKGYTLWQRNVWGLFAPPEGTPTWGAYSASPSDAWFTGETAEEVAQKIDAALAEVPDPVYW